MRGSVASLDPREIPVDARLAGVAERVAALVYDRLVNLDENGQPEAALAVTWQHDAAFKRWEFRLRPNVEFHDGTPLTPDVVATWWKLMDGTERSAGVVGDRVWIQSERAMPDLLMELAQGRNFVFRLGADGGFLGTGAFRVRDWQANRKLAVAANEEYWGGRPYVDGITIEFGVSAAQEVIDFELGRAEVVELEPAQARRATQGGRKVWSSAPVEILAVVADANRGGMKDARVREALSWAIDRASIANVLLQRQGEAAGGLLPEWLSGYAFLFDSARNAERARQLLGEVTPAPGLLTLAYETGDTLARAVAERVALNARDAGLSVQAVAASATNGADMRLVRLRLETVDAGRALESLAGAVGEQLALARGTETDPAQLYAAERALLESRHVIPLAHLPETLGVGAMVRNWMPRRWGQWRLADVWLDTAEKPAGGEAPAEPAKKNGTER
jgi:peptide/nickel transport system substrate-binding protein